MKAMSTVTSVTASRPEALRQVIFAFSDRFASKGEPLRRSEFK